jgi:hypothetical protein
MSVADIFAWVARATSWAWFDEILSTIVISAALLVGKRFALRLAGRAVKGDQVRLRAIDVQLKFATAVVGFFTLLSIWGPELKTLALSLTAIAAALIVTNKEMLMGVIGSLTRRAGLFRVGDIVEINGLRGEVVDHGFFSTTLAELRADRIRPAPDSRLLFLPNAFLITQPVTVDPAGGRIQRVDFDLPVTGNPRDALAAAQQATLEAWSRMKDEVLAHSDYLRGQIRNEVLAGDPETTLAWRDHEMVIRVVLWGRSKNLIAERNAVVATYLEAIEWDGSVHPQIGVVRH